MIDVHCLVHTANVTAYEEQIIAQMKQEKCANFHIIKNGKNIGLGRVCGFLTGNAPYVSYVDYDDLIEPGIFTKINEVMDTGIPWCYTDEVLVDKYGKYIKPGWSSNPELYPEEILSYVRVKPGVHVHHILTFRRDLITPKMCFIMKQLSELSEEYLRTELAAYDFHHIEEVGYYYRQHENNTLNNYECYRFTKEMRNDSRVDCRRSEI